MAEADGYVLVYVRYHVERRVRTGTRSRAEGSAMAEKIAGTLFEEQEKKMWRRENWRPAGLTPPPVQVKPEAGPFNAPRIVPR